LTVDTAAVLFDTEKVKPGLLVYAAPAAAVGAVTLEDGAGALITTLRAPVSGTVVVDLGDFEVTGLEVAAITASSLLTIFPK
jgi:hypothetical protein